MTDREMDEKRELAEAIYEAELLPKLLATEKGKILVLDVESRDFAIGADLLEKRTLCSENDTRTLLPTLSALAIGPWVRWEGEFGISKHDHGVRQRVSRGDNSGSDAR